MALWIGYTFLDSFVGAGRVRRSPWRTRSAPRRFTDEFKRQIVEFVNVGKPKADVMRGYDLSKSAVDRWAKSINATGSPRAADNRTPEQNRVIELELCFVKQIFRKGMLTFFPSQSLCCEPQ